MTVASGAAINGAARRSVSRASRSFRSCRTSCNIAAAPCCRNSSARRRARSSVLAVTKSLTSAAGQTIDPMSRPSRIAPLAGFGGWAAKFRCRSSSARRTSGIAATIEAAAETAPPRSRGSESSRGWTSPAALAAVTGIGRVARLLQNETAPSPGKARRCRDGRNRNAQQAGGQACLCRRPRARRSR